MLSALSLTCLAEGNGCAEGHLRGYSPGYPVRESAPASYQTYVRTGDWGYFIPPKKTKEQKISEKAPKSRKSDSIYVAQYGRGFTIVSCKHMDQPYEIKVRKLSDVNRKVLLDTSFVGTYRYMGYIPSGTYTIEMLANGQKEFRRLVIKN